MDAFGMATDVKPESCPNQTALIGKESKPETLFETDGMLARCVQTDGD
jgi:hypothetical protein